MTTNRSQRPLANDKRTTIPRPLWLALTLVFILMSMSSKTMAQANTADISGFVTDSSGYAVPNAKITVKNLATQQNRVAEANATGQYVFTLLPPGQYSVSVEAVGFKIFSVPDLDVSAGDRARVDASMQIGVTTEIVSVSTVPPALQNQSSTLSTTIGARSVQDLPLNGRNFVQLAQLVPGANEGPPNALSGGGKPDDRRQTASISVNGQSDVVNNEMIDGLDNNERIIGTIGVRPSVEAIAETRISTNLYTADVGRSAAGVVNVITKSGTNDFHGSGYEFYRNDKLDAKDAFAVGVAKPKLRLNQFGGSLGGPIIRNRTFFFVDYEQYNSTNGLTTLTNVPTLYEENHVGDFSDVGGPVLPASAIDPVGAKYFDLYPAPNSTQPGGNYVSVGNKTQTSRTYDVRVDHKFNENNLFFARYTSNDVQTFIPGLLPTKTVDGLSLEPGGNINAFSGPSDDRAKNLQLNFTHIFTPSLLLELKAGYTRIDNESLPLNLGTYAGNKFFNSTTINVSPTTSYLPPIFMSGVAADLGVGVFVPLKDIDNTFQYMGAVTYNFGAHSVKMGAGLIRRQATNVQDPAGAGQYQILNLPNLLQGNFVSTTRQNQLFAPHYRTWEPSVYVQDDWRASKSLTLNLGVRYDVFTPFTEAHNHISNFDLKTGTILVAGQNGVSATTNVQTYYSSVAPRLGFALSLGPKTVLRGGYGLSFFPENYTSSASLQNVPFVSTFGPCSPPNCIGSDSGHTPYNTLAQGLPAPSPLYSNVNNPNTIITALGLDFHPSYLHQFNLTAQREAAGAVMTVSYVGMLGRHLAIEIPDQNAPLPNTCGAPNGVVILKPCSDPANNPNNLRPYAPRYANQITEHISEGSSAYHSLQASAERRFESGLAFNVNYTLAHGIDDTQGLGNGIPSGLGVFPKEVALYDRGNSDLDIRNRVAGYLNYVLPFGKQAQGLRRLAIGGWQTNAIYVWETGLPFTVVNASSQSNAFPNGEGNDRPNIVGNPKISNPGVGEFFNVSAFQPQAFGTVGTESRNPFHGPHYRHFDFSIFKEIPLERSLKMELRAEFFNLTNTPNYSRPNIFLATNPDPNNPGQFLPGTTSGGFGTIQSTLPSATPRQIQFAAKLMF